MLERRAGGLYASSVFFEHLNDIDIYVEDTAEGYQKIFAILLSRAMSSNISLDRVFPLGSRVNVVAAAKEELSNPSERRAAYIVDGDLYLLCGEFEELPSNVIRLDRYCIENFLIDIGAILKILDAECHSMDYSKIMEELDYAGWIERSLVGLKPLFIAFAAAHGLRSGIQNVSAGSKSVCANSDAEVSCDKAIGFRNEIIASLENLHGRDVVRQAILDVESKVDAALCFLSTYVSAKDFLLPLLFIRMRSIAPSKSNNISLKMRLAMECSVEPLTDVVRKVAAAIQRPDILPGAH